MTKIPRVMQFISALGVLPFILGVLATFGLFNKNPTLNSLLFNLSLLYGALILSFLGGCLFGFESLNKEGPNNIRPWIAIIPTIWALVALQITDFSASILAVGFLLAYEFDRRAKSAETTPDWWLKLRLPLTVIVILSLSIIGFYRES